MRRKTCRRIVTPVAKLTSLFRYQDKGLQWRLRQFRTISLREARQLEQTGEVEQVVRQVGDDLAIVGYQALKPIRATRPSPATLTLATMESVAGLREGMQAERELNKFALWAYIGDDRAVAVRPRVSEAYRKRAKALWGRDDMAEPMPLLRKIAARHVESKAA